MPQNILKRTGCDAGIRSTRWIAVLTAVVLTAAISGCISDQGSFNQIYFSGYVRSSSDSSAIPEVGIVIDCFSYQGGSNRLTYCNSSGYYEEQLTIPTGALSGQTDVRQWLLVAFDADGDSNGVFVSRDTLLNELNPQTVLETHFEVDFYLEME